MAAWRDALQAHRLRPATVLRKLTAPSSLYGEFVALGAARRNPVEEIEHPDCPGSGGRRKPEQTGRGCRARMPVQKIASFVIEIIQRIQ